MTNTTMSREAERRERVAKTREMRGTIVKGTELELGDVVRVLPADAPDPYRDSTVINIKDGWITLFRPYATTADFSYTGGVIPYIGVSEFKVEADRDYYFVDRPMTPIR